MNVLLLNASPRPAGIVSQALDAAASTARQAGAETVKAELYRAPIAPCTGCMRCRATGVCPLPHDAAHELGEAIRRADLLVVGTPTYWGGMAARLKLLFERNSAAASQRAAGRRHRRLHHAVALQSALPPEPGRRAQRARSALDGRHAHPLGRDRRHQSARRSSARSRQTQNRTARGAGPENEMTLRYG